MNGNGAYPDEMDFSQPEIANFSRALRATLVREPDPARSVAIVKRLADEARTSATVAAERAQRRPTAPLRSGRRASSRRRLAFVALAVAMVPLLTAGLAAAGVRLPDAAESVFDTVGIELPNQGNTGSDDPADRDQGSGNDGEPAASPAAEPGSEKAVKGDRRQGNGPPSHSNAGGNENPGSSSNGKAKGKPAAPPGQTKPKPDNNAGGNGDAGGNGKAVGKGGTPPGQAKKPASPGNSGSAGSQGKVKDKE